MTFHPHAGAKGTSVVGFDVQEYIVEVPCNEVDCIYLVFSSKEQAQRIIDALNGTPDGKVVKLQDQVAALQAKLNEKTETIRRLGEWITREVDGYE